MASVKLKFRASKAKGREGVLCFQILHNRVARQITTTYKIFSSEWDSDKLQIIPTSGDMSRQRYLQSINSNVKLDLKRLNQVFYTLLLQGERFTADDVVAKFQRRSSGLKFFEFASQTILNLRELGRFRTSETYSSTLNSFKKFRKDIDVDFEAIDSHLMQMYEGYLAAGGASPNTTSFYMRIMRAIYNRAVENGIVKQQLPFKHVYTGVGKTVKRAMHIKYIRKLKDLDLKEGSTKALVRDIFLFSFYTRGMSFVDMAYLRKDNLVNGILSYRRRKTKQQFYIKWEECMQDIVDKYDTEGSPYLLPIIRRKDISDRMQYRNALINFNKHLKSIGVMVGSPMPLTMYVARHSWASVAHNNKIPISVISEGMGHHSEVTTRIYLSALDTTVTDKANRAILKLI